MLSSFISHRAGSLINIKLWHKSALWYSDLSSWIKNSTHFWYWIIGMDIRQKRKSNFTTWKEFHKSNFYALLGGILNSGKTGNKTIYSGLSASPLAICDDGYFLFTGKPNQNFHTQDLASHTEEKVGSNFKNWELEWMLLFLFPGLIRRQKAPGSNLDKKVFIFMLGQRHH